MQNKILDLIIAGILVFTVVVGLYQSFVSIKKIPITGAQVIDTGNSIKSDSIGSYMLNPSFSIDVNYNIFKDLREMDDFVKAIEKDCYGANQIPIDCIKDFIKSYKGNLEFSAGACGTAKELVFEQFIEEYYDCLNSEDNDCACEFSPPADLQKNRISADFFDKEYKIKICNRQGNDCTGRYMKLEKPENGLGVFSIENPIYAGENEHESEEKGYLDYFLRYNDDGSFKDGELGIEKANLPDIKWDYERIKLYKNKENKLTLVKEIIAKDRCNYAKRHYRFCAINKNKKSTFFRDGKIVNDNMPIKFAIYINDLPPQIIKGLNAQTNKKHDKSAILSWKSSEANDAGRYRVYYSETDFSALRIKNHQFISQNNLLVKGIDLNLKDAAIYKNINLNEAPICDFDGEKCAYKYKATKPNGNIESIKLEKGKLYFLEDEKSYMALVNGLTKAKYYFAVTAIDINDNEINNIDENQKLSMGENFNIGNLADELSPGIVKLNKPLEPKTIEGKKYLKLSWESPEKNIDGTKDFESGTNSYKVYYELKDFESVENLDEKINIKSNEALIPFSDLQTNKEYFFGVIAVDKLGNAHKENIVAQKFSA